MLLNFFHSVKNAGIPVSTKELLVLLEALQRGLAFASVDEFYLLSRTVMVKDEKYYDRFDKIFGAYFESIDSIDNLLSALIPEDWIRAEFSKTLTEEERKKIETLGGLEALIKTFKERLEEQKKRHQGGNRWIGTGGTSPFGNSGEHPEGIRVGGESRNKTAVKVWEKRQFRNLDDDVEIGTRNIKMALRKLRKFARSGAADELDLKGTIKSTAENAGLLDIKMVPERHNAIKVLIFFDVGGSMDPYIELCEELFSACRSEFKHLEYFYFHNCVYESVWKDNLRRGSESISTMDILHKYSRDYRVVFVGDASMSPYEVLSPFGSVEHMNEEAGIVWLQRILDSFDKSIWLNPIDQRYWGYTQSIKVINQALEQHMYSLTLEGLEQSIRYLSR
ncbi:hypothetical protein TDB9533_01548 [Thalassocella blandensis]|nr:hypothetical protein TDB9533_01548 [Thalassocella blandensis]